MTMSEHWRNQPRDREGRWDEESGWARQLADRIGGEMERQPRGRTDVVRAVMKIGNSSLTLGVHEEGRTSIIDRHGNVLRLSQADIESGGYRGRSGKLRDLAYDAPIDMEHVGDRKWMTRYVTRDGKPFAMVTVGLHKTHVEPSSDDDDDESYLRDRQTLHIAPDGGVDDPDELFARPGIEVTTRELQDLADTLQSLAAASGRVDTGHGHVDMHVVGKDYTIDPGQPGQKPIVLTRGELRNVVKALSAAFSAHDPDEGNALPADQAFTRTIPTRNGEIVVTRPRSSGDFWIESDTTAVRISPDAFHDMDYQLDAMLNVGPELKKLAPGGGGEAWIERLNAQMGGSRG